MSFWRFANTTLRTRTLRPPSAECFFLDFPEVEPTNNRAERGLRPVVIARKIHQRSKNETGAGIFETKKVKSITTKLALRGLNVARGLVSLMRGGGALISYPEQ